MNAIRMLVRRAWRRHVAASVLLAIVAGASAALVGASFQAADRASTSLDRFAANNRIFDVVAQGCPPGVDPNSITSQSDAIERCVNTDTTARLERVLHRMPQVERTAGVTTLVGGLSDPSVSNGWGRLGLIEATTTTGAPLGRGRPIVVEGRNVMRRAPDEIVLGEAAARDAGIHAGDIVRMSGWKQRNLDAAIDGSVPPETKAFPVRVVGIVRFVADVQPSNDSSALSDAMLAGNVYAGPGWFAAHGSDFSGYGAGVAVRVRGGPAAAARFRNELQRGVDGWSMFVQGAELDSTPKNIIDLQRRAVQIFAVIAAIAAIAFVGSTLVRQLGREAVEVRGLSSLGMTRGQRRGLNLARSLTVGVPAALVAVAGVILLSPLGPVGLARRLEFDLGIRIDPAVLLLTALGSLLLFVGAGAIAPVADRAPRIRPARPSRVTTAARSMGPVAVVGATVARGRSTRAVVLMTAIAVAGMISAAAVVSGYDDVISSPKRYGVSWDVAVGQYSDRGAYRQGVATITANPAVARAAGYRDETDSITANGHRIRFVSAAPLKGRSAPVVSQGRAPRRGNEIALGRVTAAQLDAAIGDRVDLVGNRGAHRRVRVVGIAVINDPITNDTNPGKGAVLPPATMTALAGGGGVPQSIVVGIDPRADRDAAIASLQRAFPGSIRPGSPQSDIANAGRLRSVPWFLAGLIGLLALITLVHALVTMLGRHRTTLAVTGAIGFTRGQRRRVAVVATTGLVVLGIAVGVPSGLVLGNRLWRVVTDDLGLDPAGLVPWIATLLAALGALAIAVCVALGTSVGSLRNRASGQLRVE